MTKNLLSAASAGAGALLFSASPALASVATPGPLLAAGAPALGIFAAGYYLIRRRRAR